MEAVITSVKQETPDTVTLRFDAPLEFVPGQFVILSGTIGGQLVKRSYSLSCAPNSEYIEVTIKQQPDGRFSNQQFAVGQIFSVQGPFGKRFVFDHIPGPVLLIAAGSGIAPFRSYLQTLQDKSMVTLVFSVKTAADIIYKQELDQWQQEGLNLIVTLTRLTEEEKQSWAGSSGRIAVSTLSSLVDGRLCYLCGSTPFVQDVKKMLLSLAVPEERIRIEQYGSVS